MHSLSTIIFFALVATLALAAPSPRAVVKRDSFKVPRLRTEGFVRNGTAAMIKSYNKYKFPLPAALNTTKSTVVISAARRDIAAEEKAGGLAGLLGQLLGGGAGKGKGAGAGAGAGKGGDGEAGGAGAGSDATTSAVAATSAAAASIEATSAAASSVVAASATPAPYANATGAASAASGTSSGQVGTATNNPAQGASEYITPINIGGQTLMMDFDTGSSDLWVFSSELPAADINGHTTFNSTKSSTFTTLEGATFGLSYGDGSSASGTVGKDKVVIGGATVTSQAVELATAVSGEFIQDTSSDGLVGLAYSSLNSVQPQQQQTFFANIIPSLKRPVLSADLDQTGAGTYEFGSTDPTRYTGQIAYTAVNTSSGFWQFNSATYNVAGTNTTTNGSTAAIVDTGTSLLLLNPDIVEAYYAKVSGAVNSATEGGYTYPCSASASLPPIAVAVGDSGYAAAVSGMGLEFAQVDSTTCFGGLQSNAGQDIQILGDVMIRQHYVVFDGGANKVGFAAKAASNSTST